MVIAILSSTVAVVQTTLLPQSRLSFSMARDRVFPAVFAVIHRRWLTPWIGTLIAAFLSAIGVALTMLNSGSITSAFTNLNTANDAALRRRAPVPVRALSVLGRLRGDHSSARHVDDRERDPMGRSGSRLGDCAARPHRAWARDSLRDRGRAGQPHRVLPPEDGRLHRCDTTAVCGLTVLRRR